MPGTRLAEPVPVSMPGSAETPPGLHGLLYAALSGMDPQQGTPLHRLIYIIIIGGLCWPVHRPGVAVASGTG